MPHISKRRKGFLDKVDRNKTYGAAEALKLVKETATAKFDEAIDVAVNLGIDAKKGDQTVRGSVVLPAGTGKKVRVAVFAPGDKANAAKAAGAENGGMGDPPAPGEGGTTALRRRAGSPRGAGEGGQDGLRRGDGGARGDACRRPARSDPRSARPNAEPEGGDRDAGCGGRREEREGGPGAVPRRQGGRRAVHDRARVVFARAAARQPRCAGRCAEQGEAGRDQGHFSEEAFGVEHDGGRRKGRSGIALGPTVRSQ